MQQTPNLPARWVKGLAKANANRPLAGIDATGKRDIALGVIERCLNGEYPKDIAPELGISRQALNDILLTYAEDEWKRCQVTRALTAKEKAEDDLEAADDALALARARERLKAAQWDLERVCRRIYGQDHGVTINIDSDWGERLRRAKQRTSNTGVDVIDVTPLNPQE